MSRRSGRRELARSTAATWSVSRPSSSTKCRSAGVDDGRVVGRDHDDRAARGLRAQLGPCTCSRLPSSSSLVGSSASRISGADRERRGRRRRAASGRRTAPRPGGRRGRRCGSGPAPPSARSSASRGRHAAGAQRDRDVLAGATGSGPGRRPGARTRPRGAGRRRPATWAGRRTTRRRWSASSSPPAIDSRVVLPEPLTARTARSPRRAGTSRSIVVAGAGAGRRRSETLVERRAVAVTGRRPRVGLARRRRRAGADDSRSSSSGSIRTSVPCGHSRGEVGRQVDDALGADHDVLRAVAALGPDPAAPHGDRARERARRPRAGG